MTPKETAEDFLHNYGITGYSGTLRKDQLETLLIKFAKLHVKAALEAAANNAEVSIELSNPYDPESEYTEVNKQSILSAYPESNIK